jgi:hypothetical protein
VLFDAVGYLFEHRLTLGSRVLIEALIESLPGSRNRTVDILGVTGLNFGKDLPCCRIPCLETLTRVAWYPFPPNVQFAVVRQNFVCGLLVTFLDR